MTRRLRVLHVLSQRPGHTGSGVTLNEIVGRLALRGHHQSVVVGIPAHEPTPEVGGLAPSAVRPLRFGEPPLDFPVPGMSDVMPYASSVFSGLTAPRLAAYRSAWLGHLGGVVADEPPDVICAHHLWVVTSLVAEAAPGVPFVAHCHGTAFRQAERCPELVPAVVEGCRRAASVVVLHDEHGARVRAMLGPGGPRVRVVGAGYAEGIFHSRGRDGAGRDLVYAGKISRAKGLWELLDAVEVLASRRPGTVLHVAGSGSGEEAEGLERRMAAMGGLVVRHGPVPQEGLASLMRRCAVFVLPSYYEGLPLVLVEAAACGALIVATALPGVVATLGPALGTGLTTVSLPRLRRLDEPEPADLPSFVEALAGALEAALGAAETRAAPWVPPSLASFTWDAVTERVETALVAARQSSAGA